MSRKKNEPLIVCYHDILANISKRCRCTELMRYRDGDFQCRDSADKVVAEFHHDQLIWVQGRIQ